MVAVNRRCFRLLLMTLMAFLSAGKSNAAEFATPDESIQLVDARTAVAAELQLMAADLLDEFVFGLKSNPIFQARTNVVLAGVGVPYGFGAGLSAYLENHFAELVVQNRDTGIDLIHCPDCTALVTHSSPNGTVMARGLQLNDVLAKSGANSVAKHAVFLDFEAEKSQLVLRGRITEIRDNLPIVFARTIASSTTSPSLLRQPSNLKTVAEARAEYLAVLRERPFFSFPLRVSVSNYAVPDNREDVTSGRQATSTLVAVPPMVWIVAGAEAAFTQSRVWTGEFHLGFTNQVDSHDGWLAGGRFSRLISGRMRSMTEPDLYLVLGGGVVNLRGNSAAAFRNSTLNVAEVLADRNLSGARASFASYRLGLEARVKNRVSMSFFLEAMPSFSGSANFGSYLNLGSPFVFQTAGMEVGFWF
ncbi:MAG: hypothetical protein ACO3A4_04710 [Silvanigrellaceae bacterium]